MAINTTYLSTASGRPLTKSFSRNADGSLETTPYPLERELTSHGEQFETIVQLYEQLLHHAEQGHCMLRGNLTRAIHEESRAGLTKTDDPTHLLVIDNDHLHDTPPQHLMDTLGIGDMDYIVQYSSSAGVKPGKRSYHIFVILYQPWKTSDLKKLLKYWNLTIPEVSGHIALQKSGVALSWPLDLSVCDNSHIIYIAPPVLGDGVTDNLNEERIQLVRGTKPTASLSEVDINDQAMRQLENDRINQLRKQQGLPKKEIGLKKHRKVEVARNPDAAQVTGIKEEREFVYLNLNGGDSWGYYHPIGNPEILYNFKGEPNYAIKELLPDYYPQAKQQAEEYQRQAEVERKQASMAEAFQAVRAAQEERGTAYVAFREKTTDQYYVGSVDFEKQAHDLNPISAKNKINDYLAQYGIPEVELIETWDYRFEPANDAFYDPKRKFVNKYTPTSYQQDTQYEEPTSMPPKIRRVIFHALGSDEEVYDHFVNWLAVIFQKRIRTQTAWILQGTTGTGKGMMFEEIIRPLIGSDYTRQINLGAFEEQFNAYAEQTILLMVDEVDTDQVRDMPRLMARMKTLVTEPTLQVRAMRTDLRSVPNHMNLILASNQPNSMRIEANDRRFNVCPRQESKLLAESEQGEQLVKAIQDELSDFALYLHSYPADPACARRTLENEPKRILQTTTQTAAEEVTQALQTGDLKYFIEHLPSKNSCRPAAFDGDDVPVASSYTRVVQEAVDAALAGKAQALGHRDLFSLYELLVGGMPHTKGKLTKRLAHEGIQIDPVSSGNTSVRGIKVNWQESSHDLRRWHEDLKPPEIPGKGS